MKNLLIIIALWVGLGFYSVQAQSDQSKTTNSQNDANYNDPQDKENADDPDKSPTDRKADRKDKSKVGKGLQETGSAVGSGAKWTWGKVKHNKLTKNVFNQPEDN